MADILVVVPDRPYKYVIEAICQRSAELGIGEFTCTVHPDSRRDAGVRKYAHEIARRKRLFGAERERFALALFDFHGSGCNAGLAACEQAVELGLSRSTFANAAACICVDPEFEQWLLMDLPALSQALHVDQNMVSQLHTVGQRKYPADLEKQFAYMTWRLQSDGHDIPDLSNLLMSISFSNWLTDRGFTKLIMKLREWFPHEWVDASPNSSVLTQSTH